MFSACALSAATIRGIEEGYNKTTFTYDDFTLHNNLNKADAALDRFIAAHKKSGGSWRGKTAPLLAWLGGEDAQELLNATATMQITYLSGSGQTLSKLSENEGAKLLLQLPKETTGDQAYLWALKFKKLNDDTRQINLIHKYSGNVAQVKGLLPKREFESVDRTKVYNSWDQFIQERDSLLSPSQRMIQKYPETLARMAGGSNIPTLRPLLSKNGSPIYKNGEQIWVDPKTPNVLRDGNGNPLEGN